MVAILCRFKSCYPHQAERHPIRVPFLFCAAGLLRRPGRAYPQFLRANCSPQVGCPADGAFSPSRLRVTGRGISTVFGRELLPAGAKKFFVPAKSTGVPRTNPGPERPADVGRMGQGCPVPGRFRRRLTAVPGKDCPRFFASEAAKSMEKFPQNPALIGQNQPEPSRQSGR